MPNPTPTAPAGSIKPSVPAADDKSKIYTGAAKADPAVKTETAAKV